MEHEDPPVTEHNARVILTVGADEADDSDGEPGRRLLGAATRPRARDFAQQASHFLRTPSFFLRKLEGKETPCSSGGREGSRRRRRDQHLRLCESDAALGPRRLSGLEQLLVKRRQTGKKLLPHRTDNAWTRQLMVIRREFGVYGILSHTVMYRLPSTEPYAAIQ